ncbi:neural cell adhesion molecule 1 [Oryzias melastigma]|uniref:neural cell adhesion molecule 1 n=1 Tax=Oryzias melastigma TaxID=30732 RepID=UPI000CF8373F|nr:neural cell adhesion molecule 1 [Oryzias melastigma]
MLKQSPLILRMALLLLQVFSTDAKMDIITSKQDFKVGEEILLLCKAGGEGDITWLKDGEDVDEEIVKKVDETSSKVVIKEASLEDAGRYTCKCDYDNGHQDDTQVTLYVYEGPSFGSTTTYHEFLEGTDGNVPCLVTGKPAVDVQWFRDKQEIPSSGLSRLRKTPDNTLHIGKVRREDAGMYVCYAHIRGRPMSNQLLVSVVVNAPPTVRLREEVQKVIAGPETNVSLLCLVDGLPKPVINWTLPVTFDPSHHRFNSDRSQLTINSVVRADFGEYICTATNKIAENSATFMLHVFEAPEVFVSADQHHVSQGESVSVSCNVSGHPEPELHWLNKPNGQTLDLTSGRVSVVDGVLEIDDMMPSDGGLYSCMAVSSSGNASRDVAIYTQPGPFHYLSVSPGPTSVLFSLKTLPVNGGAPIKSFVLQWKQNSEEKWSEMMIPVSDPLTITNLKPYTDYTVRLAALNVVGTGPFSEESSVRTQGIREPDSPVVSAEEIKIDGNTFSVPVKQSDDGGSPLLHFQVRYKQDAEVDEWKEIQLQPDTNSVTLKDLAFGSDYQLEITAVNANGSSMPATFNFTIAERPVSNNLTKGSVVGIVMVIFLVVFLVVDATCCYRNRCGLLMSISVKLFGQKIPGLKMLDGEDGATKGEVNLKGIATPRGSLQNSGGQTLRHEGDQLTEVTCDKAPLTKHEKTQISTVDA